MRRYKKLYLDLLYKIESDKIIELNKDIKYHEQMLTDILPSTMKHHREEIAKSQIKILEISRKILKIF
jgi:hypothetical protein